MNFLFHLLRAPHSFRSEDILADEIGLVSPPQPMSQLNFGWWAWLLALTPEPLSAICGASCDRVTHLQIRRTRNCFSPHSLLFPHFLAVVTIRNPFDFSSDCRIEVGNNLVSISAKNWWTGYHVRYSLLFSLREVWERLLALTLLSVIRRSVSWTKKATSSYFW